MKFHKIIFVSAGKCRKMNRSFFVNLRLLQKISIMLAINVIIEDAFFALFSLFSLNCES